MAIATSICCRPLIRSTVKGGEAGFGRIYRTLIADGLMSIMARHIALPRFHPAEAGKKAFEPASVSHGQRRYRGGRTDSWMNRAEAVPAVIMGGCYMFLFSRDPVADVALCVKA
nr:hypothetical protein [uncultured organism]